MKIIISHSCSNILIVSTPQTISVITVIIFIFWGYHEDSDALKLTINTQQKSEYV